MKPITIERPCNENWAAMSPSEKGAFCGKCQVDVVDFSNKSAIEVKLILQESAGKHMCGRFKKTQLDDLNQKYIDWENQDSRTLQSKFLYALLIVFGMTLFTGCGEDDEIIMGDFAPEYYKTIVIDTSKADDVKNNDACNTNNDSHNNNKFTQDEKHIKGKVAYDYDEMVLGEVEWIPDTPKVVEQVIDPDERLYIKGEIAYIPDPSTSCTPITVDTTGVPVLNHYTIQPVDTTGQNPDPQLTLTEGTFQVMLYPNPTRDISSVVVLVEKEAHFVIELFDITGQRLASVFSGVLPEGRRQFDVPLAGYEPGNYLVTISDPGSAKTVKIQRVE